MVGVGGRRRRGWPLPVLVALLLATAACSTQNPDAQPAADDALVVGMRSEPEHLSPILGYGPDGGSLVFDGLVERDASLQLRPALAAELPTISDDGRTVTFTLRDGVTFHDGEPLTSADVVFTYESILDDQVDSAIRGDLEAVASVEAPDERTVVFHLKYPYAPLVQRTTVGIVPEHAFEGASPNDAPFNTQPVGTGPYAFTSWTPGDKLQLEANEDYWGGAPAIGRLVLAFAEDDGVRATRMTAGEFDVTELTPKDAEQFRDQEGVTVYNMPSADYRGIMLPFDHPVTGDAAIREALSLAVDRQAIVDTILAGAGNPAFGPIKPGTEWHNAAVTGAATSDSEAAARVLEDGGWAEQPGGIRVKDGQPARFALMYPASDALRKELALAVASDAKAVGLDVRVAALDWDTIYQRVDRDALIMGWGSPYDPDYINYDLFHSRYAGGDGEDLSNPGNYRNATVDQALDAGRESGDPAARKQHYDEFQAQLHADKPWVYLVYLEHTYVVRGAWDGVQERIEAHEHSTGGFLSNLHTWAPAA